MLNTKQFLYGEDVWFVADTGAITKGTISDIRLSEDDKTLYQLTYTVRGQYDFAHVLMEHCFENKSQILEGVKMVGLREQADLTAMLEGLQKLLDDVNVKLNDIENDIKQARYEEEND